MPQRAVRQRLVAILAADAAGYSRLMSLDDRATVLALDVAREVFRDRVAAHEGRIVDTAGDSVLAIFDTAIGALGAALEAQERLASADVTVAPGERMRFRIGVHLGDVIEKEDGTVYGDGVNIAARLEGLAEPGGIAVSQSIEASIHHRLQVRFVDIGVQQVKNIAQPIRAFRCEPAGAAGRTSPEQNAVPAPARPRWAVTAAGLALVGALAAAVWSAAPLLTEEPAPRAYSTRDRRMTFAVLPFIAPADDEAGRRVATAVADAVSALLEKKTNWVHVVPRLLALEATKKHASPRDIGRALDVHFLLRGVVSVDAAGYRSDLALIDTATDRVLDTQSIRVPAGALLPKRKDDIDNATSRLTYAALTREVDRVRARPIEALDVRDLTFRAFVDTRRAGDSPEQEKAKYDAASGLLNRALAIAPDDSPALAVTAQVNLCSCVASWSKDTQEQEAIGTAAMEKYLRKHPDSSTMLALKTNLYMHHGRFEEALLVAESLLRQDAEDREGLLFKTAALLRLGRLDEALATSRQQLQFDDEDLDVIALAAAVRYRTKGYADAAALAQKAITLMDRRALSDPDAGSVALALIAAEGQLGRRDRAAAALRNFNSHVPTATTITVIKAWLHRDAWVWGDESLYEGLRLAGVAE